MRGRFARDNAFLLAAVALPALVVVLFVLAAAVPRWRVAPPSYDLLLRTSTYERSNAPLAVEFTVRDGTLHATLRPASANVYPERYALWLYDSQTLSVRQVPLDLPNQLSSSEPQTVVVEALKDRRVIVGTKSPDGYEVRDPDVGRPGLVGELFGMSRSRRGLSLRKQGRVEALELPAPYERQSPVFIGWLADAKAH